MSEFNNKTIQIESIEIKDNHYKLIGSGFKCSFFSTKKDGTNTQVYQQFLDMNLKKGDLVDIGYVEETFMSKTANKEITTNKAISFREASNMPTQTEKPHSEPPVASQSQSDDKFWDKKAYKQCLWNYWLKQSDNYLGTKPNDWMDVVWDVFNQIEKDADERFSKPKGWDNLGAKLKAVNGVLPPPPLGYKGDVPEDIGDAMVGFGSKVAPDIQEMADEMGAEVGIGEKIPF